MKAIAVFPGQSDTVHLADLKKPSVNDAPDGRGVLVRILKVGVDGTDKEINSAEYGTAPNSYQFLVIGHEGWKRLARTSPSSSPAITWLQRCAVPAIVSTTRSVPMI